MSELLYRYGGLTQVEMGRLLGGIDYSAVSKLHYRLRKRMASDKCVREQYAKAESKVRGGLSSVEI